MLNYPYKKGRMKKMDYDKLTKKYLQIKPYLNENQLFHYKQIEYFDAENTYHSNAIEGNTLTLKETALVLDGYSVGNKMMKEIYEISNHSKAFNHIFDTKDNKKIIDVEDIIKIHTIILDNIDDYNKGRYRQLNVGIRGTNIVFPYPQEIPNLMISFGNWLVKEQQQGIMHPIQFASKAHFDLVDIHPFIDGNGRTSRLLMNMILLKNHYPPLMIKVEEKLAYIEALNNTRENNNEAFDRFIYQKMEETLDYLSEQIKDFDLNPSSNQEKTITKKLSTSKPKDYDR
jgi:Fic family protein